MARSAGPNELQTSIRISQNLYDRLDSAREGRPLGEEIRRRLDASFADEAPGSDDQKTREAVAAIAWIFSLPRGDTNNVTRWHDDAEAFADARAAIAAIVDSFRPAGAQDKENGGTGRLLASLALGRVRGEL